MTDYEELTEIIGRIDGLIAKNATASDLDFKAWHSEAEILLCTHYTETSLQYKKFKETIFYDIRALYALNHAYNEPADILACREALVVTKKIFESYLKKMKPANTAIKASSTDNFKSVFIVHGHNGELKANVARVIEKQKDISAIILDEQVNQGATIIEKFEKHSDVSAAIILFTADDVGHAKAENVDSPRARQNVVLEAGFFIGKLGRERVIIIKEAEVELPSDLQGMVYSDQSNWKVDVLNELDAIGFTIDYSKLKNC